MTQPFTEERFDELVTPDISHLIIEDDTPVNNLQSEKQQRLLVEPLYSSKVLPPPFLAAANVGLFYKVKADPIVPDAMLSLGIQAADDFSKKQNRSYFVWEFGKLPEVCIEIVSNAEGDELTVCRKSQQKGKTIAKKALYAQIRIPYYVVFDPLEQIQGETEMNGALLRIWMNSAGRYIELTPPDGIRTAGRFVWLEEVGLGLMLWSGAFEEEVTRLWLRWCDQSGQPIPTGAEGQAIERQKAIAAQQLAETERLRAETERLRSQRLADRLRSLGVDPDEID